MHVCAGTGVEQHHKICRQMPLAVVGGFSQAEGVALGAFTQAPKLEQGNPVGDNNVDRSIAYAIHGLLLDDGAARPPPRGCGVRRCADAVLLRNARRRRWISSVHAPFSVEAVLTRGRVVVTDKRPSIRPRPRASPRRDNVHG